MQQQLQWFNPWEPVPHFFPPSQDQAVNDRINVTVKHAVKNGPAFLEMMKEKHRADPNFTFLFMGEAYHYFRWVLFSTIYNLPVDQPPPQVSGIQGPSSVSHPVPHTPLHHATASHLTLPADMETGFKQVLEGLSGSKVCVFS
jgi:hypothetical protein